MRRLALSLALAAAATAALATPTLGAPSPPASSPPSPMAGETLYGNGTGAADQSCSAPVTFSAEGVAAGPYPGTFTETATYDHATDTFVASFRIVSGTTIITGTKTQGPEGSFEDPFCETTGDNFSIAYNGDMVYEATIQTASGIYHDEGTGQAILAFNNVESTNSLVSQEFESSLGAPVLVEACKPGNGKHAKNGCHSGAPGQTKKAGSPE